MAITLRNAGTWATITEATAVTLPTHQTGDMLIVRVVAKSSNVASNVITCDTAGWVKLGQGENGTTNSGNGTGSVQVALFYKIATSASETNPTITPAVDFSPAGVVAMAYQKNATEIWMVPVGDDGPDTTSGTSHSATIATHVAVKVGDVVDAFTGICDNTTMTVPTFTQAGVTYDTVTESPATALDSLTSNDIAADGCYRTATAGISSAAAVVTSTLSTSETGTSWMTRLRVVGPSTGQAEAKIKGISSNYGQAAGLITRGGSVYVIDTFTRSETNSLGTADTGGTWVLADGSATTDVNGSEAVHTIGTAITNWNLRDVLIPSSASIYFKFKVNSFPAGNISPIVNITSNLASTLSRYDLGGTSGGSRGYAFTVAWINTTNELTLTPYIDNVYIGTEIVISSPSNDTWYIVETTVAPTSGGVVRTRFKIYQEGSTPSSYTLATSTRPSQPPGHVSLYYGSHGSLTPIVSVDNIEIKEAGWTESGQAQALIGKIPVHVCGAECGLVNVGASSPGGNGDHWDFGQSVVISNTIKHTGNRSYQFTPSAAASYIRKVVISTSHDRIVGRAWVYIDEWPTATQNIIYANVAAGAAAAIQVDSATHELEVQIGGDVNAVSRTGAISLDTWYCIDFDFYCGTNGFAKMRVNEEGTTYQSNTTQSATSFSTGIRFGTASTDATFQFFVDDIIVSGRGDDFPFDSDGVAALYPNSSGSHSFNAGDFKDTGGTNISSPSGTVHTLIDDAGASDTVGMDNTSDYVQQAVINSNGYINFGFSAMPENSGIEGVQVVSVSHSSSTTANTSSLAWWDGSVERFIYQLKDVSQTTLVQDARIYLFHPSQGNWSTSVLDAVEMRWGYSTDVTDIPFLDGVVLEVAYKEQSAIRVHSQAQATIKQIYNNHSQAQAAIKQTYFVHGQAQAFIIYKQNGLGQTAALINGTSFEVYDTFTRSVTDGMGTADIGGDWTRITGTAADADVNGTEVTLLKSPANYISSLRTVLLGTQRGVLFRFKFKTNPLLDAQVTVFTIYVGRDGTANTQTGYAFNIVNITSNTTYSIRLGRDVSFNSTGVVTAEANVWFIAEGFIAKTSNNEISGKARIYKEGQPQSELVVMTSLSSVGLNPGHVSLFSNAKSSGNTPLVSIDDLSIINGGWQEYGQAQADIKQVYNVHGQAQSDIKQTYNVHAQANALIQSTAAVTVCAQAQGQIKTTYNAHGQAQSDIKQTYYGLGQSQARIKNTYNGLGQAQSLIMQLVWYDTFTRTITGDAGAPDIGGQYYVTSTDKPNIISGYYQIPANTGGIVTAELRMTGQTTLVAQFDIYTAGLTSSDFSLKVNNLYSITVNNSEGWAAWISGSTTYALKTFSPGAGEWWTIKAYLNHSATTARVKVWQVGTQEPDWQSISTSIAPGTGVTSINANSDPTDDTRIDNLRIISLESVTYTRTNHSQAQAQIKQTYNGLGQAQGQIKQTYNGLGQAQGTIKTTYFALGQAQGQIKQTYVVHGQAQADIKQTYAVHGQSQADIKQTYYGLGQSQAVIVNTYFGLGQAQALIKNTYFGLGQAQASIKQTYVQHGQANADILQTYVVHGQAQSNIKQTYFGLGQAQGTILTSYVQHGQSQADIKQTYVVHAQAQGTILTTYNQHGQSQASIKNTYFGLGQALGYIYIPQISVPVADTSNNGWIRVVI